MGSSKCPGCIKVEKNILTLHKQYLDVVTEILSPISSQCIFILNFKSTIEDVKKVWVAKMEILTCRLCLSRGDDMLPLFNKQGVDSRVLWVFNVKIVDEAGVPSHICCPCLDRLNFALRFKEQIISSYKSLDQLRRKNEQRQVIEAFSMSVDPGRIGDYDNILNVLVKEENLLPDEDFETNLFPSEAEPLQSMQNDEQIMDCGSASFYDYSQETPDYVPENTTEDTMPKDKKSVIAALKKVFKAKDLYGKNCGCIVCGKTFSAVARLCAHMEQHGMEGVTESDVSERENELVEEVNECEFCNSTFSNKRDLDIHACRAYKPNKIPLNNGSVKCSICGKPFTMSKDLTEHVMCHRYSCNLCDTSFIKNNVDLRNHMDQVHDERPYGKRLRRAVRDKNLVCSSKGGTQSYTRDSELTDSNCSNVSKRLRPKKIENKPHDAVVEDNSRKDNERAVSNRRTENRISLLLPEGHVYSSIQDDPDRDPLAIDDQLQPNPHAGIMLKTELNTDYEDLSIISELPIVSELPSVAKLPVVSKVDSPKCACLVCGLFFSTLRTFSDHMSSHEVELQKPLREYICPIEVCGKKFDSRKAMKKHRCETLNFVKCTLCDDTFYNTKTLEDHLRNHQKQRSYRAYMCVLCPIHFRSKLRLKKHVKKRHSDSL